MLVAYMVKKLEFILKVANSTMVMVVSMLAYFGLLVKKLILVKVRKIKILKEYIESHYLIKTQIIMS